MRTGPTGAVFLMARALISSIPPPAAEPPPQSASHSPMQYLYGGLAAVFGLIALGLLIFGCSHFNSSSRDEEGGSQKSVTNRQHHRAPYVEQFVVIMAGDANPSFLATPIPIHPATSDANVDIDNIDEDDSEKTKGAIDGDGTEPH